MIDFNQKNKLKELDLSEKYRNVNNSLFDYDLYKQMNVKHFLKRNNTL